MYLKIIAGEWSLLVICCPSDQLLPNGNFQPFSSGSIDGVKVSVRAEVKHHEKLDFDTVTSFPADNIT
jgi:hypothetical protein